MNRHSRMENTSGQGKTSAVPPEIKGWNWGAFFLNFIWAVGNKTWIGLLTIVPLVGYIVPIILGLKGNEWAWKNRRWKDIDHFKRVQKKWAIWGASLIIPLFVSFAVLFFFAFHNIYSQFKASTFFHIIIYCYAIVTSLQR